LEISGLVLCSSGGCTCLFLKLFRFCLALVSVLGAFGIAAFGLKHFRRGLALEVRFCFRCDAFSGAYEFDVLSAAILSSGNYSVRVI
jgi:hypothetical protein